MKIKRHSVKQRQDRSRACFENGSIEIMTQTRSTCVVCRKSQGQIHLREMFVRLNIHVLCARPQVSQAFANI